MDWKKIIKDRDRRKLQKKFEEDNDISKRVVYVELPENEWHECDACKGTGQILMEENLHESAGWVPCHRLGCYGGQVRGYIKTVYRVKSRTKE